MDATPLGLRHLVLRIAPELVGGIRGEVPRIGGLGHRAQDEDLVQIVDLVSRVSNASALQTGAMLATSEKVSSAQTGS
ncbi:MAG TPA: hypothetical protein VNO30_45425 [Kofleriaceae bacterium]|nr:hypothetical protein [Kofleriaceae bacterium]